MEDVKVILLGPPGVGKGTIAGMLEEQTGAAHMSTGDMLREEVKKGTVPGKEAEKYMNAGDLVPDEVVIDILRKRIKEEGKKCGFVLDGFPRTLGQARELKRIFDEEGVSPDRVLNLRAPEHVIVQRLGGRRQCSGCGRIYHVRNMPPAREGICDDCGGELFRRADDCDETIRVRLRTYERQTAPLVDFYREQGLLSDIKADTGPEETFNEVRKRLDL